MKEIKKEEEKTCYFETGCPGKGNEGVDVIEKGHKKVISINKTEPEQGYTEQVQLKNMKVKIRIAMGLERMGLSKEAIGRILNLEV